MEAAEQFLKQHSITMVELATPDMTGAIRGKRIPVQTFLTNGLSDAVGMSSAVLAWDYRMDVIETDDYSWANGYPDIFLRPDVETLRLVPWKARTALVFCDVVDGAGRLVAAAPREVLRRAVAELEQAGLSPYIAMETEFYALDGESLRSRTDRNPVYSLHDNAYLEPFLDEVCTTLLSADVEVEACGAEYAPGQVEINLTPSDPVTAADGLLFFRYAVKQLAQRHGYRATFMAKPFGDLSGSGLHIHQSMWRTDRDNAFWDANARGLSDIGRNYVAGLLRYAAELHLVAVPTPNGYKRVMDHSFAPTNLSWGWDNRCVAVRVLAHNAHGARVESRVAAADANPYLLAAAQLSSGLAGVTEDLKPAPPAADAYVSQEYSPLPTNIWQAATLFGESEFARRALGAATVENLCRVAWSEAAASQREVSEWERSRYLDSV
ncbi:glutamine synthetase family protein [Nocardia transvalensis]|uniref:glutamine synthetase family protein n=1 Tax=Nocardia transvalensis TaxID=37333 RepID=UPI0018935486|nr:glutamine synthetase family protein [Nocardia transvalensis]MBF6332656.1 glutamine synthetase [Nocardia transvalensis]